MTAELGISQEVINKIQEKLQPGDKLYLDFEDGDGPFANTGITCRLDISFRLIVTPGDYPPKGLEIYSEQLTSPVGLILTKKSVLPYLEPGAQLAISPAYQTIQLKGKSGVIADNISLLRIEQHLAGSAWK